MSSIVPHDVINFINKYGYVISQTYNDYGSNLLAYINDCYDDPDNMSYAWSCFFAHEFLHELFRLGPGEKVQCQDFGLKFSPGKVFYFDVEDHEFNIFYFDDDAIYLADYYAEEGRDYFSFALKTKDEVLNLISNDKCRRTFLQPISNRTEGVIDIGSITLHEMAHSPTIHDIVNLIKKSFDLKSMIQEYMYDNRPRILSPEEKNKIDKFIDDNNLRHSLIPVEESSIEDDIAKKMENYYRFVNWLEAYSP
jgi:hypothetical protein